MDKEITADVFLKLEDSKIGKLSFEEGLKILEHLVSQIEGGDLSLEKAVISYEKGTKLAGHLRKLLDSAEERITILKKGDAGFGDT